MLTDWSRIQLILVIAFIAYTTRVLGHSPLSAELDPPNFNTPVVGPVNVPRKLMFQAGGTSDSAAAIIAKIQFPDQLKNLLVTRDLFANYEFTLWVDAYTSHIKNNVEEKMLMVLRKHFTDPQLFEMFDHAKRDQGTLLPLATNLKNKLIEMLRYEPHS
ncbi:hypothetical protein PsorP6_017492 [Peronosclerospora sorghi]|uniref:Uncharacterized protein n=1 Tax=Peronosclerospora sorghi TaxID=230839 RepID=A0ACC0WNW5_9STRA|nr:hypothetical protein PsorP6_017492 [Peronosclerospora sorghi]